MGTLKTYSITCLAVEAQGVLIQSLKISSVVVGLVILVGNVVQICYMKHQLALKMFYMESKLNLIYRNLLIAQIAMVPDVHHVLQKLHVEIAVGKGKLELVERWDSLRL